MKFSNGLRCQDVEALLSGLIDGELESDTAEQVSAHLADCPRCRLLAGKLGELVRRLQGLSEFLPPPGLSNRIREQALRTVTAGRRGVFPPGLPQVWPARRWLVAAAVFLAAAGMFLLWSHFRQPQPLPPASRIETVLRDLHQAEGLYCSATAKLEQLVRSQSGALDPGEREVFEKGLAAIDALIVQAQTQLRAHPDNSQTWEYLLAAYQKKVDFLKMFLDVNAV